MPSPFKNFSDKDQYVVDVVDLNENTTYYHRLNKYVTSIVGFCINEQTGKYEGGMYFNFAPTQASRTTLSKRYATVIIDEGDTFTGKLVFA